MSKRGVLTTVWFIWGGILLVLFIVLTLAPTLFGSDTQKAWQWFLPNLIPVLTLVGAGAYAAPPPTAPSAGSSSGSFPLALGSSVFYLLLLTGSLLSTLFSTTPLETLTMSSLWLGPVQGIATSGLALYFVKR